MSLLRRLNSLAKLFGFNVTQFTKACRGLVPFFSNMKAFYAQYATSETKAFPPGKLYPCLVDRFEEGAANGAYFHQDLLVAQMIYRENPKRHLDVGSQIAGFVAHVATFREIEVLDIRPLTTDAKNIKFRRHDIQQRSPELDECTDSLSCLHVGEHFGLGRYGDPVDYDGHQKGFANLARMVKPGGRFYFSVPIGTVQRFEFDAHRVFSLPHLLTMIRNNGLLVDSFAYVDDTGALHERVDLARPDASRTFELNYGCGIFALRKP